MFLLQCFWAMCFRWLIFKVQLNCSHKKLVLFAIGSCEMMLSLGSLICFLWISYNFFVYCYLNYCQYALELLCFFFQLCKLVFRNMTCSADLYMNKLIWLGNGIRIASLLSKNIAFVRITAGPFEPEEWIKLEKLRRLPRRTASQQVKYIIYVFNDRPLCVSTLGNRINS